MDDRSGVPLESETSQGALSFWAHTTDSRIFSFRYEGPPRRLHPYLLERYGPGRGAAWAREFYPARVRLEGAPVSLGTVVTPGMRISYRHQRTEEPPPPPLTPPLYLDDWVLALEKPDCLPVNPVGVHYYTSLAVLGKERFGEPELTPLHRLDLETSGVVLFARKRRYLHTFHKLFHRHAVAKRYRALVYGQFPRDLDAIAGRIVPDDTTDIHTKLRLEPLPPDEWRPAERNQEGSSLTRILSVTHHPTSHGVLSELALEPVTGKTNQIRVHLAHVGHPIVGDKKYHPDPAVFLDWAAHKDLAQLDPRLLLTRQALHCESIALRHPFTGEELCIRSAPGAWAARIAPAVAG